MKEPPARTRTKPASTHPGKEFPVVALGASAGGLEAFIQFFRALPPDSGMAFIVVAHLDPTHISLLPELLQKQTAMPVSQARDKQKILPGQVYVIPPNKDLTIRNRMLYLLPPPRSRGMNLPIDSFFRSLSQDLAGLGAAIVLSGTGSDGTLGVKAVKEAGGVVMVQDEASAVYPGMPKSAVATGCADYILAPGKMPEQLISYFGFVQKRGPARIPKTSDSFAGALPNILTILRNRTGHDFSLYKQNTLQRRLERRLHVHQIERISDYVQYLQKSETESSILFKELLIGVTSFFRDTDAFGVLRQQVIPDLMAEREGEEVMRIWIPGCSTGEEVYSLAMVLDEAMKEQGRQFTFQIFGTDIDEDAIDVARSGLYPSGIQADVSPERLKHYFTKENNGYFRVRKGLRERIVFAVQNVIKDPPFTRLDLISCRNLLIYLNAELQKRVLPVFSYSLKPGGILFLGSSETIGTTTGHFRTLDRKWKIYKHIPDSSAGYGILRLPAGPARDPGKPAGKPAPPLVTTNIRDMEDISELSMVETILRQSGIPPGVVTDETGQIHYIHGSTGKFLEPPVGTPRLNLFDMARGEVKKEILPAIRESLATMGEVVRQSVRTGAGEDDMGVNLVVRPLIVPGSLVKLFLILFEERGSAGQKQAGPVSKKRKRHTTDWLEHELNRTRNTLHTTIEELETSNEELKSTNEELQSTNEEMQSANEELETSREELQSMNEESATINAELQCRIDELSKTNDDMKNLLDSTDIAIIFLDQRLHVRRFTPRVTDMIPLTDADIGRPVSHFASTLRDIDLELLSRAVLEDLSLKEAEVEGAHGNRYRLRIRPYRTVHNVIDGVVITLENFSGKK